MTREQKLEVHLEMVIWEDLPPGTRATAKGIQSLIASATPEQKERAYQRALVRCPILTAPATANL